MLGLPSPDGLLAFFSDGKSHRKCLTSGSASVGRRGLGQGLQGQAASKGDYKEVFRLLMPPLNFRDVFLAGWHGPKIRLACPAPF